MDPKRQVEREREGWREGRVRAGKMAKPGVVTCGKRPPSSLGVEQPSALRASQADPRPAPGKRTRATAPSELLGGRLRTGLRS